MSSNFNRITCILLFSCVFAFIVPVFAQDQFEFIGNRNKENIAFKKSRGLIVVPVYINNKGPFNFILDTGVGNIIITNPKLKDSLSLKYLRKLEIYGLGESGAILAYSSPFLNLKIGNTELKSASVAVLADDIFNLSGYAGLPIDGLIGYEFFNSFRVQINYEAGLLKVYNHKESKLYNRGTKIPIEIKEKKPYLSATLLTDQGEKFPLNLLIDTGSGHPISLESYHDKAFPLPNKFVIANLGVGLGGNIRGFHGRINELMIGKFHFNDIVSAFPYYEDVSAKNKSVNRNGSIGNPIFRKFNVLFDYKSNAIYLKPLSNYKLPFDFDMSGLELVAAGEKFNRYVVARVERLSAADEFGLEIGDEIIEINFNAAAEMTLEEIIKIFSSKEGRTLYVEVKRGEQNLGGILTLKKRI